MQTNAILVGISALAILTACGGSNESYEKKVEETAARYGVDVDVTVGEDGEINKVVMEQGAGQFGKNIDLPADFPSDVATVQGLSLMSVAPLPGGGFSLQGTTTTVVDDAVAEVLAGMSADGWTDAGQAQKTPQMSTLRFEKEGRLANYTFIDGGENNMVQISTMKKP